MNIIFLDIDGVLNHSSIINGPREIKASLCPENVYNFNKIMLAVDAKIIVSSSWRYMIHNGTMTIKGFNYLLNSHGLIGEVLDITRKDNTSDEPRFNQIWDSLSQYCVENYVILDDDISAKGDHRFIHTDMRYGLTEELADKAISILLGE
jgi:hypothetical protein